MTEDPTQPTRAQLDERVVPVTGDLARTETDTTRAELIEALEHRERQVSAIRKITGAMFSHTSVDGMAEETLATAIELVGAEVGSIQLYDPKSETLIFRYVLDPSSPNLVGMANPTSKGISGRVFRTGSSELTEKVTEDQDWDESVDERTGYRTDSLMTVPLKKPEGAVIGVMQVLNAARRFDRRDLEVLEILGAQAAAALDHAQRAEQARKAELFRRMGDFVHEIKNMMVPIITGLPTIKPVLDETFRNLDSLCASGPASDSNWPDAVKGSTAFARAHYGRFLDDAVDSAERARSYADVIQGAMKGEFEPPEIRNGVFHQMVRAVQRSLQGFADHRGVEMVLDLDENLTTADFDDRMMFIALFNLVNNAIPATPRGGRVTVRTRAPDPGEDTLEVEVSDTGHGMPKDVCNRWGTETARTTKEGGSGLGSRIVAGIISRHSGTISVRSETGRGSVFTIRLPVHGTETSVQENVDAVV